jgi:hypothetical protein
LQEKVSPFGCKDLDDKIMGDEMDTACRKNRSNERNCIQNFGQRIQELRQLRKLRHRRKDNIKMHLKEIRC